MQVFKAFYKIVLKKISIPLMYLGIFLAISFIITGNQVKTDEKYTAQKLNISVIDNDNTEASRKLTEFLKENHDVEEIEFDREKIVYATYYAHTDYAFSINEGYMEKLANGQTDNLFTNYSISKSYSESLADSQINRYVSSVSAYLKGGFTLDEAMKKTSEVMLDKTETEVESFQIQGSNYSKSLRFYFQYIPFIITAILISALVPTLLILNDREIRTRTNASCLSSSKQTFQSTLASVIYAVIIWLVFIGASFILGGKDMLTTTGMLAILNSFIFMLVALSITMLVSVFSPNPNATSMIANTVSLGMSFLCGVFVPLEYLSTTVKNIAHFLPAYWFVRANNMIAGVEGEVFDSSKFLMYTGIQLMFAVAIFALVFLVANTKKRSKN